MNRNPLALIALLVLFVMANAPTLAAQESDSKESGIVVTDAGIRKLTIGGELRGRTEFRNSRPPVVGAPSQSLNLLRGRVDLEAEVDDMISGYIQLQESVGARGAPSTDTLHQAYIALSNIMDMISIQAGRMELQYGNQRMVSPLDWSNFGRAWDGGRIQFQKDEFAVDVFGTQAVAGQGGVTGQEDFYGLYGQWNGEPVGVDLYVFKRRDRARLLDDFTYGGLVEGAVDIFKFDVEAALQTGDRGIFLNAKAYAFAARVFANLDVVTLGAAFELASGDSNPADGDSETFIPLYNFAHAYQGHADILVWQNLQDIVLMGRVPLNEKWTAMADLHFLSRAETADAVYTFLGSGPVATTASSSIGTELDLSVKGKIGSNLGIWGGVSWFKPGNAIFNANDQFWFFLQAVLSF